MKKHIFTFASLLAVSILGCYPVHGMTPLTPDEVKELGDKYGLGLGRNSDANKEKESYSWAKEVLKEAIRRGDEETVSRIVRSFEGIVNSDIVGHDGRTTTPLIYACNCNRFDPWMLQSEPSFDMVKLLLQNGANVNARDLRGRTALHAKIDSPRIVALLLEHGADISARCNYGGTVLFNKENVMVVCQLINAGVDAKAANKFGGTALYIACYHHYKPELIAILADVCDVNAKHKNGGTALTVLLSKDELKRRPNEVLETVRVLLRKGADPSIGSPLRYLNTKSSEGAAEAAALLRAAMEK